MLFREVFGDDATGRDGTTFDDLEGVLENNLTHKSVLYWF